MVSKKKQSGGHGKRKDTGMKGTGKRKVPITEPETLKEARRQLRNADNLSTLATAAKHVLNADPADSEGWLKLAQAQLNSARPGEGLVSLSRALRIDPDNETLLEVYINEAVRQEQYLDAISAARHWAEIGKEKPVTVAQLLSGLYGSLGKEELSCQWGVHAASLQPLASHESGGPTRIHVLVLQTFSECPFHYYPAQRKALINEGHNNLVDTLDQDSVTFHFLAVDVVDQKPEVFARLPEVNVIYNSISDAGRCNEGLKKAKKVCQQLDAPVINQPQEIMHTTRNESAKRLGQCEGVLMPRNVSLGQVKGDISEHVRKAVANNGFKAPIIVRPSGFQNGLHMYLIDDPEGTPVRITDEAEVYVLQYHDVTFTDARAKGHRFHPKYRAFMVGGKLYPAHLRMGHDGDWNVHGEQTRKSFRRFPWLYDMERDYIEDPSSHFEDGVWDNLERALNNIDLDYFGVDFAICTEPENQGKIVIFEANASMRSFLRQTYQGTPENDAALDIILAVHRMLCTQAGIPEWDFTPPKGLEGPAQQHDFGPDSQDPVTEHVLFSGDLQGHGFREWLWLELHKHNLTGWMRNLSDGRVEALICGSQAALDYLLEQHEGPEGAAVAKVKRNLWSGPRPSRTEVADTVTEPVEPDAAAEA